MRLRLYVKLQDEKILKMLRQGKQPKAIASILSLKTHNIYDAVKRNGFQNISKYIESFM